MQCPKDVFEKGKRRERGQEGGKEGRGEGRKKGKRVRLVSYLK